MSTDNCLISRKNGRFSSGSLAGGATVISPLTDRFGNAAICSVREMTSSLEDSPNFVSSPAILTSIKIGTVTPFFSASLLIVSAKRRLSTEWISVTLSTIYFTLFLCRCPIICHFMSFGITSYFSVSSCTLFSPKSRIPSS